MNPSHPHSSEKEREKLSEYKLATEWLLSDDTGSSSKTLCAHMLGLDVGYKTAPADAGDRGRCVRLLQKVPSWQNRLDEMKEVKDVVFSGSWAEQIPLIRTALKPPKEEDV